MNSNRPGKPRRLRGSAAAVVANRFALGVLGVAVTIGLIYK